MSAKSRWALLAKAIRGEKTNTKVAGSTRALSPLSLIPQRVVIPSSREQLASLSRDYEFVKYSLSDVRQLILRQRRLGRSALADHAVSQASGVDNTGNVGLWPCEEVLTYLILCHRLTRHVVLTPSTRVLELGAGVGLAGFALASWTSVARVDITDGNPSVVESLEYNARSLESHYQSTAVSAFLLKWDRTVETPMQTQYDLVIAADCLFFKDFHYDLIQAIDNALAPGGKFVCIAPSRGGTRALFIDRVNEGGKFDVALVASDIDPIVASRIADLRSRAKSETEFNEDRGLPGLLVLSRRGE